MRSNAADSAELPATTRAGAGLAFQGEAAVDDLLEHGVVGDRRWCVRTSPIDPVGAYITGARGRGFRRIGRPGAARSSCPAQASRSSSAATAPGSRASPRPWRCCSPGTTRGGRSGRRSGARDGRTSITTRRKSRPPSPSKVWRRDLRDAVVAGKAEPVYSEPGQSSAAWAAKTDLGFLGWNDALPMYRPFLSYSELGSMFDEGRLEAPRRGLLGARPRRADCGAERPSQRPSGASEGCKDGSGPPRRDHRRARGTRRRAGATVRRSTPRQGRRALDSVERIATAGHPVDTGGELHASAESSGSRYPIWTRCRA